MKRVLRRFCAAFVLIGLLASVLPVTAFAFFPVCGMEEHVHDDFCYDAAYRLDCRAGDTIHGHTAACYDSGNNLICHMADFVLHLHNQSCYSDGALVCPLPEIDSSVHSRADWASDGVRCVYVPRFSHVHSGGCYVTEPVLTCELEESVHEHDSTCYESVLVCDIMPEPGDIDPDEPDEGETDVPAHEHDESCYSQNLVCEIQDGHQHNDDCYAEQEVLICDLEASGADLTGDVCIHYEYELHTHDAMCRDDSGAYVCGKYELKSHEHNDACFVESESGLVCGRIEHRHSFECYLDSEELEEELEEEFVDEDVSGDDMPDDEGQLGDFEEPVDEVQLDEELTDADDGEIDNEFVSFEVEVCWEDDWTYSSSSFEVSDFAYPDIACFQLYKDDVPVPVDNGGVQFVAHNENYAVISWDDLEKYRYDEYGQKQLCQYYVIELIEDSDGNYVPLGGVENSYTGSFGIDDDWHVMARYEPVVWYYSFYRQTVSTEHPMYVLRKVDADTGEPIAGVTFRVGILESEAKPIVSSYYDGYLHFVKDYVTDEEGMIYVFDEPVIVHVPGCALAEGFDDYLAGIPSVSCGCTYKGPTVYDALDEAGLGPYLIFKEVAAAPGYVLDDTEYRAKVMIFGKSKRYYFIGNPFTDWTVENTRVEPEGTKLEFIKANATYRPSPYDADGNVIEDYKVATFNDGDIEADYQYLLGLDEQYGDVLIDGVKFELTYMTSDYEMHREYCWSGGVDAEGNLVNDGLDAMGVPIEHGKVVFYLPDDAVNFYRGEGVLWELIEVGGDIVRYSDTDFVVVDTEADVLADKWGWLHGDDVGYSALVMTSDAESPYDLSALLVEHHGYQDLYHHWESYSGISLFSGDVERHLLRLYTGNIIWNDVEEPEPEPEGTKLTFVKANSKYRASPYDADGNVIEDYKVATFNDGDIEVDYQYLLDLDEQYGDVLIDGVEFQLRYKTSDGKWHTDTCWSGGVDADGELVNDGCDSQGNPLRHGEIVFYLPGDIVEFRATMAVYALWELAEVYTYVQFGDTNTRRLDIGRYSNTDFVVDDEFSERVYTTLVMKSDAKCVSDLSLALYGCDYRHWESYSGIFLYSDDINLDSLRPYTGNIIWNDVEEEVSSGPMLPNTGGSGAMPVVLGCGAGLLLFGGALTVYRRRKSAYGGSRT